MSQKIMSMQSLGEYLNSKNLCSIYFCDQDQPWKSPLSPINFNIKFDIGEIIFSKSRNVICLKNKKCTLTINQIQSISVEENHDGIRIIFFCGNPKLYKENIVYKLMAS